MRKPEFTFRYEVRNWRAYNRALVRRGQLTLWFDKRAIAAWRDTTRSNEPGRPKVYAGAAIECGLVLKSVFDLRLRATQGFLGSVVALMRLDLPVPDLYGAIDVKPNFAFISLFDPPGVISSSRSVFDWPLRAAAVKSARI